METDKPVRIKHYQLLPLPAGLQADSLNALARRGYRLAQIIPAHQNQPAILIFERELQAAD